MYAELHPGRAARHASSSAHVAGVAGGVGEVGVRVGVRVAAGGGGGVGAGGVGPEGAGASGQLALEHMPVTLPLGRWPPDRHRLVES